MSARWWSLGLLACACTDVPVLVAPEGPVPRAPGLSLECLTAAARPEGAELVGLDGAVLEGAALTVLSADGQELATASVDAHGRVRVPLDARAGELIGVRAADRAEVWTLRVRDHTEAYGLAVGMPYTGGAGSSPNDLEVWPDGRAVLLRSGDGALVVFDLVGGPEAGRGLRLPEEPRAAAPWAVARVDDRTAAVTAQGRDLVYLVDLDAAAVVGQVPAPAPVPLARPFVLSRPFDVDGDGAREAEVRVAPARAPQGLAVSAGRLVVAYTGFVAAGTAGGARAVFTPGVVASWSLAELGAPPVVRVLDALDPQEVHALEDGSVLVTASGAIDRAADGRVLTSTGAVIRLDAATLEVQQTWDLGDFGPTTARVAAEALWVASLSRARLRALPLDGGPPLAELSLNDREVASVFGWVELPCGLLGAPVFDTDTLHVLDPRTRQLDPPPFYAPLVLGPGRPLVDGLQAVARRPGRLGVDFVGPDTLALAGVASRVTPLELRRILGP
jgi:sugar lactone lactonase YvrE